MRIDIVNGTVVTGDGNTTLENTSVVIEDCLITDLPRFRYIPYNVYADRYIDARGGLIIPGLINIHVHAISFGPLFTYGWRWISRERLLFNLNRHLLQGETTLLNCDGLALPCEVEATNKIHPVNIKMATIHTPMNIRASEIELEIIGSREEPKPKIDEFHKRFTAEEAVALGAVAIGEVGTPGTAYGTLEKRVKLGRLIASKHARALDRAVIADDKAEIRKALIEAGLQTISIEEAKNLVNETSIKPIAACCDAIKESVSYVKKLGVPVLAHAEPGMKHALLQAAKELGPKLIAIHVNHGFTPEESVGLAKELKRLGAIVEIITADFFTAKHVEASPKGAFDLLKEGLVDVISTDFSGGYHEPMLLVLQKAIEEGIITLPHAIHLVTSAPARIIPGVAPNKGLVEVGRVADLVIVDKDDISKVRFVIIAGRVVVEDGRIVV